MWAVYAIGCIAVCIAVSSGNFENYLRNSAERGNALTTFNGEGHVRLYMAGIAAGVVLAGDTFMDAWYDSEKCYKRIILTVFVVLVPNLARLVAHDMGGFSISKFGEVLADFSTP